MYKICILTNFQWIAVFLVQNSAYIVRREAARGFLTFVKNVTRKTHKFWIIWEFDSQCRWKQTRTTDSQWIWRHKSKLSEKLGRCGRQNMLWLYLKIWEWEWIFGYAVKAISSLGVHSPCYKIISYFQECPKLGLAIGSFLFCKYFS